MRSAQEVEKLVDVEQWTRVFALERCVGNLDCYGNTNSQNMYAYKPADPGPWNLLLYDMDLVMGMVSDGTTTSVFSNIRDPRIIEMLDTIAFRRAYWRRFQDAVNGPLQSSRYGPVADSNDVALLNNGVKLYGGGPVASPNGAVPGFKNWLDGRRTFLQTNYLVNLMVAFTITNNGGADFTTSESSVLLAGKAPPQVRLLALNSTLTNVIWHTVTNAHQPERGGLAGLGRRHDKQLRHQHHRLHQRLFPRVEPAQSVIHVDFIRVCSPGVTA